MLVCRALVEALKWDGTPRARHLLAKYMGAEDTPLHSIISRCFLVSCIARIMEPGCKVDTVLLLSGKQGAKKSTAFRNLAGSAWFADTPLDVQHKDAYGALRGKWIYEMAEMESLRRREATATKAFISSQVDRYRPSYGRHEIEQHRQTIIVCTTNDDEPLTDSTGSRRFWPVYVDALNVDALAKDRDMLWAEALHLYRKGWLWWLDQEQSADLEVVSQDFQSGDPWEKMVMEYAQGRVDVTPADALTWDHGVNKRPSEIRRADEMRVCAILRSRGWLKTRKRVDGVQIRVWNEGG